MAASAWRRPKPLPCRRASGRRSPVASRAGAADAGIHVPVLVESDSVVLEERAAGTTPVLAVGLSVQEEPPHRCSDDCPRACVSRVSLITRPRGMASREKASDNATLRVVCGHSQSYVETGKCDRDASCTIRGENVLALFKAPSHLVVDFSRCSG